MHYKTIVLELLQQYPELASRKTLLPTLDRYAADLKTRHDDWAQTLSRERPESAPSRSRPSKPPIPSRPRRNGSPRAALPGPRSRSPRVSATGSRIQPRFRRTAIPFFPQQQHSCHLTRL
jgi:hypothetical protein